MFSSDHGCEGALDHLAVEMADAARDDLLHRKTVAHQPPRVVLGLQIAGQNGDLLPGSERRQRAFEQRGLARTGRTDEVEAKDVVFFEAAPQVESDALVFVQDFLFDTNDGHGSSTSTKAMSSWSPLTKLV